MKVLAIAGSKAIYTKGHLETLGMKPLLECRLLACHNILRTKAALHIYSETSLRVLSYEKV